MLDGSAGGFRVPAAEDGAVGGVPPVESFRIPAFAADAVSVAGGVRSEVAVAVRTVRLGPRRPGAVTALEEDLGAALAGVGAVGSPMRRRPRAVDVGVVADLTGR